MESEVTNCAKRAEQLNGHIRRAGINPNRWYMIAKASDILEKPLGREIWQQPSSSIELDTANCAHWKIAARTGWCD